MTREAWTTKRLYQIAAQRAGGMKLGELASLHGVSVSRMSRLLKFASQLGDNTLMTRRTEKRISDAT